MKQGAESFLRVGRASKSMFWASSRTGAQVRNMQENVQIGGEAGVEGGVLSRAHLSAPASWRLVFHWRLSDAERSKSPRMLVNGSGSSAARKAVRIPSWKSALRFAAKAASSAATCSSSLAVS